jgi:hypothetical protein
MKKNLSNIALATMSLVGALCAAAPAAAQVAGGTTTVDTSVTESTKLAMVWSVKKTLLGKTIYNDDGQKVGKVDDLIISPDRDVSYIIVGAGGFVGIGRHDVATPVTQIPDKAGKLVMPGATKDMIKDLPEFVYATDTTRRDTFGAATDKDIATGNAKVAEMKQATAACWREFEAGVSGATARLRKAIETATGWI